MRHKKEARFRFNPSSGSEIVLWLNSYNELFSDFDPRSYSLRSLSDDFLSELKRASLDKNPKKLHLKLLIPKHERKIYEEEIIKKRLKSHFKKHHLEAQKIHHRVIKTGISFASVGVLLMFSATYLLYMKFTESLLMNFLIVLLEPGGWFLFWEGLYMAIFNSKSKRPKLKFYEKMSNSKVSFSSY